MLEPIQSCADRAERQDLFESVQKVSYSETMSDKPRPPRLADVARAAQVSQGTVSNVFNRPELVREPVRLHVHAVAEALGYSGPDPKGRLLRAGRVNAIGVATAEPMSYFFEDPFARELMLGIARECEAHGAGLSLITATDGPRLDWSIETALVDGLVLLCIESGERLVALSRARKLPFVALAQGKPDPTVSSVGIEDEPAARRAAEHLTGLGHRDFAVLALQFTDAHMGFVSDEAIASAIYLSARDRVAGYRAAFVAAGIDPATVPVFETQNEPRSVVAGLEAIFARGRPSALLCMSDRIALSAMDWLKGRGLRVPEDISVVGFDGVPEGAAATPPLTTMAQPIAQIGRRAAQMIFAADDVLRRETLPVELVVRGSTAPPPSR